jgi:phage shock protein PspC (stress-responsive transcriptional regulator)
MKRLFRSRKHQTIGGVCGGLGDFFGMDTTIWRLIFLLGTLFGFGSFFLIYIVMWCVVPKEKKIKDLKEPEKNI